jgi:arginine utilization protein RocB
VTGRRRQGRARAPRVLDYADLAAAVRRIGGEAAQRRMDDLARALRPLDNPLEKTRRLVEAAVVEARLGGPAVVIGFAGLHYPHVRLDPAAEPDRFLGQAVEAARLAVESRFGVGIAYREYFLGISDMSFLGRRVDEAETAFVAANTPAADLVDRPPEDALRFPAVNIGPWGRDYHQRLERVHAPYAFRHLPLLLDEIVARFAPLRDRD